MYLELLRCPIGSQSVNLIFAFENSSIVKYLNVKFKKNHSILSGFSVLIIKKNYLSPNSFFTAAVASGPFL